MMDQAGLIITGTAFSATLVFAGAAVASFWALVAFRRARRLDWVKGRSWCDHCRHQISWWENIPIISFVLLGGRCHHCRQRIRRLYFGWEVLLGAWTVAWFWLACPVRAYFDPHNLSIVEQTFEQITGGWGAIGLSGLLWAVGAVLIWTALVDIQTHTIDNGWLLVLAGLTLARWGLLAAGGQVSLTLLVSTLASSLAIGAVFVGVDALARLVWRQPGIGWGDTLMVMILAGWLSWTQVLVLFLLAFWLGAVVGIILLLARRSHYQLTVAFLPFINTAFLLAYFWGEPIWEALFGVMTA